MSSFSTAVYRRRPGPTEPRNGHAPGPDVPRADIAAARRFEAAAHFWVQVGHGYPPCEIPTCASSTPHRRPVGFISAETNS